MKPSSAELEYVKWSPWSGDKYKNGLRSINVMVGPYEIDLYDFLVTKNAKLIPSNEKLSQGRNDKNTCLGQLERSI